MEVVKPKPARMVSSDGRLSVSGRSHSISKSSQPAAAAAAPTIRIIHLFAPEVIQTDAANFRDLVQRLTGKQAIMDAESDRRRAKKCKSKKAPAVPVPAYAPQQQQVVAPPALAPIDFAQPESSGGAATSTDSGMYGSEEVAAGGAFMAAMGRAVKLEGVMFDDMSHINWFGEDYGAGTSAGAGTSSCSGSDVGTVDGGGDALCGFDDLEEFVQGLYEYPNDTGMMGSTTYSDLFGDSPLSGC